MKRKTKIYLWGILIPLLGGVLISLISRSAMQDFFQIIKKPPLSPPAWLFPVAWSILYVLMGTSSSRVFLSDSPFKNTALKLYFLQLGVNLSWSIIFFNLRAFLFAFLWLILLFALIAFMIFFFYKCDRKAALFQIPYFLWVVFAGYLNLFIWILNG